jgi:hypothetical protein
MAGVPQIELTEKTLSIPVAVVTGAAAASALEAAFLEASIWVYIRATSIFEAVAAAGNAVMRAVDKLGGGSTGGSTAERLDSLLTLQRDQASRLMLEMAETPEGREELMSIGRLAAARVAAGTVASNPEAGRLSSLGFQAMQFANLGQQQ